MKIENPKHFKIFIDFDGTITKKDIGEHMFTEFGSKEKSYEIIDDWLNGKINSQEVWIQLCKTIKNFDHQKFLNYLDTVELDDYFLSFIEYAKNKKFDITILSDGLDLYINKISEQNNFDHLPIYCNKLTINGKNELIPEFPFTDEECNKCANCKRNHILNSTSDEDITIYIGDGWSDTCAASHCDFIFAKRSLLKYCEKNGIPYYPFKSFAEVNRIIDQLYSKKRIKKRHQAMLKRKDVYMQG